MADVFITSTITQDISGTRSYASRLVETEHGQIVGYWPGTNLAAVIHQAAITASPEAGDDPVVSVLLFMSIESDDGVVEHDCGSCRASLDGWSYGRAERVAAHLIANIPQQ